MKIIAGFHREADGAIQRGFLSVEVSSNGALTQHDGRPVEIKRFQSVPGTIDVKFTTKDDPRVFLASKDSCDKAGVQVPGIGEWYPAKNPLAALDKIARFTDAAGLMEETITPEQTQHVAVTSREAHTAIVELLGEAKRALHLLRKYEPQVSQHKQQCRASIQNLERIFADRFGLPVEHTQAKGDQARAKEPETQSGDHHER